MAASSAILVTSDGGAHWNVQYWTGYGSLGLVAFANANDGWALTDGGDTILTTTNGGYSTPTIVWFLPTSALVGTTVTLYGTGFTGATAITFNGHVATFTVNSLTGITATVPAGASTGKITVTGPGGTATSATSFTVMVTPKLTLKLSGPAKGAITLGKRVTFKGKVTPTSLAGRKVTLTVYWKTGYNWWFQVASMTRTIRTNGTYGGTFKPAKKGSYRMMATMALTATHTAATTTWRTFRVK